MENLTNQILELSGGKKYLVIRQAAYKGKTYYFGGEVLEDESDFTDKFLFLERVERDGDVYIEEVTDKEVLGVLAKNIKIEE